MNKDNNPATGTPLQELRTKLWDAAKQSKNRRSHALYDRIYLMDVLQEAWRQVKSNGGSAGVDGETIKAIEAQEVEAFLEQIQQHLRKANIVR